MRESVHRERYFPCQNFSTSASLGGLRAIPFRLETCARAPALYSLNFAWVVFSLSFLSFCVSRYLPVRLSRDHVIQAGAFVKNLNLKIVEMKNFCDSLALNASSVSVYIVDGMPSRCRPKTRNLRTALVRKSPFCVFCFGIFSLLVCAIHWH